mmetsp:Transcript_14034/g.38350  ORF Transcript_14034/g.38350 Transcript_14034/m.38350 type:complete len:411 (-) Transcript_14034:143-1375(-)|eukprot:CAMPEP_0117462002 /NCGR_PEP_ID=MMETSP0784-20121206/2826_1 /TAXON_ID=39447 /ORGANISM="" /LENGTH=410 /DNA_ID=CAMNT_0005255747 /DNA_START=38 /DNA_END=1270 /DNA_ORIENTATION=-
MVGAARLLAFSLAIAAQGATLPQRRLRHHRSRRGHVLHLAAAGLHGRGAQTSRVEHARTGCAYMAGVYDRGAGTATLAQWGCWAKLTATTWDGAYTMTIEGKKAVFQDTSQGYGWIDDNGAISWSNNVVYEKLCDWLTGKYADSKGGTVKITQELQQCTATMSTTADTWDGDMDLTMTATSINVPNSFITGAKSGGGTSPEVIRWTNGAVYTKLKSFQKVSAAPAKSAGDVAEEHLAGAFSAEQEMLFERIEALGKEVSAARQRVQDDSGNADKATSLAANLARQVHSIESVGKLNTARSAQLQQDRLAIAMDTLHVNKLAEQGEELRDSIKGDLAKFGDVVSAHEKTVTDIKTLGLLSTRLERLKSRIDTVERWVGNGNFTSVVDTAVGNEAMKITEDMNSALASEIQS